MKRTGVIFLYFILLSVCSFAKSRGFVINCTLSGFPDSTRFYLQNMRSEEIVDSAFIIDSKMVLKGNIHQAPERLLLYCIIEKQLKYVDLLIGNESVRIQGDIKDLQWNARVTGSASQNDKNDVQALTRSFDRKRDSLTSIFMNLSKELQKERRKEIWDEVRILDDTLRKIRISYLWSHLNTYQGVIMLGDLKNSLSKDTVQLLYNSMTPRMKSSKYASIVELFLKERISAVGDPFHDFEAWNESGKQMRLSDIRGNYILLEFTSNGCMPCINAIRELKYIDSAYSDSLKIVSFSCDVQKETWLSSLKKDKITWVSLWDGKGWYSEPFIKYGVSSLPSFFLIDPNGFILEKWTGFEEGYLKKKLARFERR